MFNHLDMQVVGIEKKESRLEKAFELLENDFKYMGDEAREVRMSVENIDNTLRRINFQLKGLKEGAEGENVVHFLENLFVACLGSLNS